MGQKVNPRSFRLAVKETPFKWQSRWFSQKKKKYQELFFEDLKIRKFLDEKLKTAGLAELEIRRMTKKIKIVIKTSRPGMVIGRGGKGLEALKIELMEMLKLKGQEKGIELEVEEVKNPELSARLVGERIGFQLERRMPTRKVINRTMDRVMGAGALGVKIVVSGRVDGAEICRREKYSRGKVPLSTLRANLDYAEIPALTRSGYVGVKVYINRKKEKFN